ncbi:MAG: PRC-barrel domain-containing protein [Pirellulales bacterium]
MRTRSILAACLALVLSAAPAWAAENDAAPGGKRITKGGAIVPAAAYRGSTLIGMEVRNAAGEDLGQIEDLVIDMGTGEVRYAALSFGGFLGFGDKLFAVPMHALTMTGGDDDRHFVVDLNKERLENAPGFDKDSWPNFANPNWADDVDTFYGPRTNGTAASDSDDRHDGIVVSTKDGKLTMSDDDGSNQHSHNIGDGVKIVLDGKPASLKDLKAGFAVTVTMGDKKGQEIVTGIDARSRRVER